MQWFSVLVTRNNTESFCHLEQFDVGGNVRHSLATGCDCSEVLRFMVSLGGIRKGPAYIKTIRDLSPSSSLKKTATYTRFTELVHQIHSPVRHQGTTVV